MENYREETLDPSDWGALQNLSHRLVDDAIAYVSTVRERPVWQPMPEDAVACFQDPMPQEPTPLPEVCDRLLEKMFPYPMGNIHPRFWMWYLGASNVTGALGDFLAAILGSNLGGGNHAGALIDQQVVDWCKEIVGYPKESSGTLVSGGSMANIIGLTVARNEMADADVRAEGVRAMSGPLRFYASDQVHACHQSAVESLGLGNAALRTIPTDSSCQLDLNALAAAVAEDRAQGWKPACVIATAGTVNTGAIDDLLAVAVFCAREGIWFHVDGCVGALLALAPRSKHLIAGLSLADSIALDPHKWLHAPFEVGCALVRDRAAHRNAFSQQPEYLRATERGVAAAPWLNDYGVQTTRGFRALKVWMALQEHGSEKFGRLIDQNIAQAAYLRDRMKAHFRLELLFESDVNIVCFRYRIEGLDAEESKAMNIEIMLRLQEEGSAAVSDTTVHGEHCLRVAICNHRTKMADMDFLVEEVLRLGKAISTELGKGGQAGSRCLQARLPQGFTGLGQGCASRA